MSGFLGTAASLQSDVNLVLQIVILVIFLFGAFSAKQRKFASHGSFMFIAVLLNLFSTLIVMVPSAIRILAGASVSGFTSAVAIHSALGTVAESWGIIIVLRWRFKTPGPTCSRYRNHMRWLAALWILIAMIGIGIYYALYV